MFRRKTDLRSFVLELTPDCNQGCAWCYNAWRHHSYTAPSLGLADWKKIILKLKRQARPQQIALSGGEPLLWPEVFSLTAFIREQGIAVNLLTNGTLLDSVIAGRLAAAGVSMVQVTLPAADRALYARVKGADDFNAVTAGIAELKVAGVPFSTVFVATRDNVAGAAEAAGFSLFLGARGMLFNRLNPARREHLELMPAPAQLEKALSELDTFSGKYKFPVAASVPVPPCVLDLSRYKNIRSGSCPRGGKGSYYTVDFSGNLRVCNHSPALLGSLLQKDLPELLAHPYVARFRTALPERCRGCAREEACRGGCPAAAEAVYGNLSAPDPFVGENLQAA